MASLLYFRQTTAANKILTLGLGIALDAGDLLERYSLLEHPNHSPSLSHYGKGLRGKCPL